MKDAEEDKVRHQGSRQRRRERRKEKMYSGGERERETRLEVVTQKEKVGKEFNMKPSFFMQMITLSCCV